MFGGKPGGWWTMVAWEGGIQIISGKEGEPQRMQCSQCVRTWADGKLLVILCHEYKRYTRPSFDRYKKIHRTLRYKQISNRKSRSKEITYITPVRHEGGLDQDGGCRSEKHCQKDSTLQVESRQQLGRLIQDETGGQIWLQGLSPATRRLELP